MNAAVASSLLGLAVVAAPCIAEEARLAYPVEHLNHAQAVEIVRPGAAGTDAALGLRVSGKDWARWNLPLIEPAVGRKKLTFYARAVGKPGAPSMRLMEADGSQWASSRVSLGAAWKRLELQAGDFQLYRGEPLEKRACVDFDRVVQIQFVLGGGAGEGSGIDVDEVAFDPPDRRFTFDGAELRTAPDPVAAGQARLEAILAALQSEFQWNAALRAWAQQCAADLERLLADRRPDDTFASLAARHAEAIRARRFAFQLAPRVEGPPTQSDHTPRPAQAAISPAPVRDLALDRPTAWKGSTLYAAPKPSAVKPIRREGRAGLEMDCRFTPEAARQVVFLNGPRDATLDLGDYAFLEAEISLHSDSLATPDGFQLRVWGDPPAGKKQSFFDALPEAKLPADGTWTLVRFPLRGAFRPESFDPARATGFSFRLENEPGKASEVRLAVAGLRLIPVDPQVAQAEQQLRQALHGLDLDRLASWREFETLAALRRRVWEDPVLQRFLLRAQLEPIRQEPRAASTAPAEFVLPQLQGPIAARLELDVRLTADGMGQVDVAWKPQGSLPGNLSGKAGLVDHAGRTVAAVQAPGLRGQLQLDAPLRWSPAYPYQYRLRAVLFDGDRPVAAEERPIGFRSLAVGPGDLSPTLRHAWQPSPWEGALRLNGQPYFPHGACYHLPKDKELPDVAPLLRELWVEALRSYGWSFSPAKCDQGDREGIGSFLGMAASYASMTDPLSHQMLLEAYQQRLAQSAGEMWHPSILNAQAGNEVELTHWGADLGAVSPEARWLPLEQVCEALRAAGPRAPVTYVRAGNFRPIPVLPGEDLVGLNQYTGRYGGRIEQIAGHLDLFARMSQAAGRTLGITEWNGPQYSWASRGIGAVTERGAAYYLQRYYEAMVDTPGIALSSEFTLNWALWRVEDLTTHGREEEWRDRPPYARFGGGRTADHVPIMPLEQVYRGPAYRAVQAFQSPLYPLLRTPGDVVVAHAADAADLATRLQSALKPLGKTVRLLALDDRQTLDAVDAHVVIVGGIGSAQPAAVQALQRGGWIDPSLDGFPSGDRPLIERRLHPYFPTRGLVVAGGSTPAGRLAAVDQLAAAARSLYELWAEEGRMVRAVALVDAEHAAIYEQLLFEFVARGYVLGGDDTRTALDAREFLQPDGTLQPAWWNLQAVVLDTARALKAEEIDAVGRLARRGVRIVVSLPCYQANRELQERLAVRVGRPVSVCDSIDAADALQGPVPLKQVGNVEKRVITEFAPGADLRVLEGRELSGAGAVPIAWTTEGRRPVALQIAQGPAHYTVIGLPIAHLAELHRQVTGAGRTHPMYDRDTASGLERPGRLAVNACLQGLPQARILPRLHGAARLQDGLLKPGAQTRLVVRLTDVEGRPVRGAAIRARAQLAGDGRAKGSRGEAIPLGETSPGLYECPVVLGAAADPGAVAVDCSSLPAEGLAALGIEIKALAPNHVPWEGAASAWIDH